MPTQITARAVSGSFAGRLVLDPVTCSPAAVERTGITGENGPGRTTSAPGDLRGAERRMRRRETAMADGDGSGMAEHGELLTLFEPRGGYGAGARVERALHGPGLALVGRDRRAGSLSGGERVRLRLAAAPQVLLLDEPTKEGGRRYAPRRAVRQRLHRLPRREDGRPAAPGPGARSVAGRHRPAPCGRREHRPPGGPGPSGGGRRQAGLGPGGRPRAAIAGRLGAQRRGTAAPPPCRPHPAPAGAPALHPRTADLPPADHRAERSGKEHPAARPGRRPHSRQRKRHLPRQDRLPRPGTATRGPGRDRVGRLRPWPAGGGRRARADNCSASACSPPTGSRCRSAGSPPGSCSGRPGPTARRAIGRPAARRTRRPSLARPRRGAETALSGYDGTLVVGHDRRLRRRRRGARPALPATDTSAATC